MGNVYSKEDLEDLHGSWSQEIADPMTEEESRIVPDQMPFEKVAPPKNQRFPMKSAFVGGEKLMHLENLEATSTHGHATRDGTLRARAEDDHEAEDDPLVLSRRGAEGGAGCLLAPPRFSCQLMCGPAL